MAFLLAVANAMPGREPRLYCMAHRRSSMLSIAGFPRSVEGERSGGDKCATGFYPELNVGFSIAEKLSVFHHLRNLCGHHFLPGGVVVLDSFQYIARENVQDAWIEVVELFDSVSFNQVSE